MNRLAVLLVVYLAYIALAGPWLLTIAASMMIHTSWQTVLIFVMTLHFPAWCMRLAWDDHFGSWSPRASRLSGASPSPPLTPSLETSPPVRASLSQRAASKPSTNGETHEQRH